MKISMKKEDIDKTIEENVNLFDNLVPQHKNLSNAYKLKCKMSMIGDGEIESKIAQSIAHKFKVEFEPIQISHNSTDASCFSVSDIFDTGGLIKAAKKLKKAKKKYEESIEKIVTLR